MNNASSLPLEAAVITTEMSRLFTEETNQDDAVVATQDPNYCSFFVDTSHIRFWFDGVLVSVFACLGVVGNLLALVVLSRPRLHDVFHQLLFALACFDLVYIVCGGVNYTFRAFGAQSDIFTYLFPYLIYPMTHVTLAATIFMTVAISIERYLGLCHPMLPPQSRKAWFYVVPVLIISVALNIPKFLEVRLNFQTVNNTTVPSYGSTSLRFDETYIRAYIMWTRLFSTAVLPVALLLYLNSRIMIDLLCGGSKVQRFGSARRQRKEINLCILLFCIVFVFFLCHTARIVMDVYEFSNVEKVITCKPWWPSRWTQILTYISHMMMILNSSGNFIIYCLVGHNFRRELCRTFNFRRYGSTNAGGNNGNAELSRRSSRYDFNAGASNTTGVANTGNGSVIIRNNSSRSKLNSPAPEEIILLEDTDADQKRKLMKQGRICAEDIIQLSD